MVEKARISPKHAVVQPSGHTVIVEPLKKEPVIPALLMFAFLLVALQNGLVPQGQLLLRHSTAPPQNLS
jgi:hypothetical protein